ncbi:MAG: sulfatase [Polyangiaceae bacterium]|nr:sulfatase [Polyangiaceae bacterium]
MAHRIWLSAPSGTKRGFWLGGAIGFVVALGEQVGLPWLLDEHLPLLPRLMAGAIPVCLLAIALGLLRWAEERLRGRVAVWMRVFSSLFCCAFVAFHTSNGAVKWFSGAYLTAGEFEFAASSPGRLFRLVWLEYADVALVVAGTGVAAATVTWAALRERDQAARGTGAPFSSAATLLVLGIVCGQTLSTTLHAETMSPLMAMLAVGQCEPEEATCEGPLDTPDDEGPLDASLPSSGPVLEAARGWEQQVRQSHYEQPNVLLVVIESVNTGHLGFAGYERAATPNLDRLAAESVRFPRAWTTATHSNYAQPALLSSLFPRRTSGLDLHQRLSYPRFLFHDVFHTLGYATATISSQDETWQGMLAFQQTGTPTHFFHALDHQGPFLDRGVERVVPDHLTAARAVRWIAEHRRTPWALYLNLQASHFPYSLPAGVTGPFQPSAPAHRFSYLRFAREDAARITNRYDNALHYVDAQIGTLHQALEGLEELQETLWIVTADHGELFFDHGLVTHGRSLYEGETRVPLLFYWPERLASGERRTSASHLDILPSVLDLIGLPAHPSWQGTSLFREDEESAKAVLLNIQGARSAQAVVCWPWKLIVEEGWEAARLFQLVEDGSELFDVADREPDVAVRLEFLLRSVVSAQMQYHAPASQERLMRFAPRLPDCP